MARFDIEIQTRKMLKPSCPTPSNLRILNLSLFDQLSSHKYVAMLFNYLPSSTCSAETSYAKLEKSLAETLTKFYPFAGRFGYDDDELSICCNDEGVEYVVTKVKAHDLAEFVGQAGVESSLVDLLPVMVHRPSSPLLGVQVNVFNNGGLAIGIQISHIVADAFTLATFVNVWAHTTLTGKMTRDDLSSFGQVSSLFPARVLPTSIQLPSPDPNTAPYHKIVTKRFVFDALAIEKLRKTIQADSRDPIRKPTRVVVVMSLLWKVLTSISYAKNGNSRDSCVGIVMNLRGKLSCRLSLEHALGNYTMIEIANREGEETKDQLNDFVKLVGNTIRNTCVAIGKAESVYDISSLALNNIKKGVEKLLQRDKIDVYPTTSWCKFPWYEADFGWGKPFWVSPVNVNAVEATLLMDTKDGDGIQIMVGLKENDMTEFERDPLILSYTSKPTFHSFG